ncbi:hypothetical protein I6F07_17375 [Ensifer sp. IC4062]|nr:hypothetical protein [Ensifer sp. IC4062]
MRDGRSDSRAINQYIALEIDSDLSVLATETLEAIVASQAALRLRLMKINEQWFQFAEDKSAAWSLGSLPIIGADRVREFIFQPFDPFGELTRFGIVQSSPRKIVLLAVWSYVIADDRSRNIFEEEFGRVLTEKLKKTFTGSPRTDRFLDFVEAENSRLADPVTQQERLLWDDYMKDVTLLFDPGKTKGKEYVCSSAKLSGTALRVLRNAMRSKGITFFHLSLSLTSKALARRTRRTNFCVRVPFTWRHPVRHQATVGMFVDSLAVKIDGRGEEPLTSHFETVRQSFRTAYTLRSSFRVWDADLSTCPSTPIQLTATTEYPQSAARGVPRRVYFSADPFPREAGKTVSIGCLDTGTEMLFDSYFDPECIEGMEVEDFCQELHDLSIGWASSAA